MCKRLFHNIIQVLKVVQSNRQSRFPLYFLLLLYILVCCDFFLYGRQFQFFLNSRTSKPVQVIITQREQFQYQQCELFYYLNNFKRSCSFDDSNRGASKALKIKRPLGTSSCRLRTIRNFPWMRTGDLLSKKHFNNKRTL